MPRLNVGDLAPDFELLDDQGRPVRLRDFRGRPVLLYFYPKAMTSGCTRQACAFRDAMPDFERLGVAVLGISPDPVERLQQFKVKEGLNFPLLSDPDHAVAEAYGVWGEKSMYGRTYMGIIRSQFLIDENGIIRAAHYKISPAKSVPTAQKDIEAWQRATQHNS